MIGSDETAWDALIGDLYLAALDGEAAARVAPALAKMLNAGTAALWSLDTRTGALAGRILNNFAPENMSAYAQHWHAYDPWTLPLVRSGYEGVIRGGELIEDKALLRHPFYAEYGVKTGHFHVMGSVLQPSGRTPHVGAIAVQRPHHLGAFADQEFALLQRLLPHARRALQLDARVHAELLPLMAGRAALDAMETAAIVLDGHGTVLHANAAAETMDRTMHVIRLRKLGEDSRVSATRSEDTLWLRQAIADAARGGDGGARRLPGVGSQIYAAIVTPLPKRLADRGESGWLPGMALLVLRLIEPLTADKRLEDLCIRLFAFTPAEARTARLLVTGMSPEEIAEARDVRISTVRTLLTRGMDKSGAQNLRHFAIMLASLTT